MTDEIKKAFLAGFDAGADDAAESGKIICEVFYKEVTEAAYAEYCVECEHGFIIATQDCPKCGRVI